MYNLIKLTADFDDSFVFFIISKDVHKTFNYLATQINSKNVKNPLFKFLSKNRKKLYDLKREVVFSSDKLDEVEKEKRKIEGREISVQPIETTLIPETKVVEVSIPIPKPEIIEEIKPKTKRTYNKKTSKTDDVEIQETPVVEEKSEKTLEVILENVKAEEEIEISEETKPVE